MVNKMLRGLFTLVGLSIGMLLIFGLYFYDLLPIQNKFLLVTIYMVSGIAFALIFFTFSHPVVKRLGLVAERAEDELKDVPTKDIIMGTLGLILGLIIAYFISQIVNFIPPIPIVGSLISLVLTLGIYFILGYLGIRLAQRSTGDIEDFISRRIKSIGGGNHHHEVKEVRSCSPKILDTSVIIDGRIKDVVDIGFIEGTIVVPNFVLLELQHIADSSDSLRRSKGRRGLDILNDFQSDGTLDLYISHETYDDIAEVDSKLIAMALDIEGKIITNDYNLNKLAGVQGVEVLNINELSNALKPVVIHGETMNLFVLKEGKEENQGLSYLDDGTMIVIEGGKQHIGENIDVIVTSVLQTSAGKMIFGKVK